MNWRRIVAIGVGYSANACGGDAVTTGAAGREDDQLMSCRHQA
ncbi:hypothetical protein ACNKHU_13610 [Shigella flexneri]